MDHFFGAGDVCGTGGGARTGGRARWCYVLHPLPARSSRCRLGWAVRRATPGGAPAPNAEQLPSNSGSAECQGCLPRRMLPHPLAGHRRHRGCGWLVQRGRAPPTAKFARGNTPQYGPREQWGYPATRRAQLKLDREQYGSACGVGSPRYGCGRSTVLQLHGSRPTAPSAADLPVSHAPQEAGAARWARAAGKRAHAGLAAQYAEQTARAVSACLRASPSARACAGAGSHMRPGDCCAAAAMTPPAVSWRSHADAMCSPQRACTTARRCLARYICAPVSLAPRGPVRPRFTRSRRCGRRGGEHHAWPAHANKAT
jgi:hypothetical protein